MGNLIENICLVCVTICIIGLIASLAFNTIFTFTFSVVLMLAFWVIAIIDISRK